MSFWKFLTLVTFWNLMDVEMSNYIGVLSDSLGVKFVSDQKQGSSGIWTRDHSHPKRVSYP